MVDMLECVPPQSIEAEQACLGAMLLERSAVEVADEMLCADDFYREAHKTIYTAMLTLYRKGEPVDLITLGELLKAHDQLGVTGGASYLTTIMFKVPTAAGIHNYAGIVREVSKRRQGIKLCDRLMKQFYDPEQNVSESLQYGEGGFAAIGEQLGDNSGVVLMGYDEAEAELIAAMRRHDEQGYADGFKSPLPSLNRILQPIMPTQFVILAARPGVGKSSFLAQWCYTACVEQGQRGMLVTLEMSRGQIALRRIIAATGLSRWRMTSLAYRQEHPEIYEGIAGAVEQSRGILLQVLDTPTMTPGELQRKWAPKAAKRLGGLDFIAIDYIQKVDDNRHTRDLTPRTTELAKELKGLAKALNCAVIAVSSLSRAAMQGDKGRPELHHLRESGQLEYEADVVIMMHRPDSEDLSTVEIGVVKQRDGEPGWRTCGFDARHTWFYDGPGDVPGEGAST